MNYLVYQYCKKKQVIFFIGFSHVSYSYAFLNHRIFFPVVDQVLTHHPPHWSDNQKDIDLLIFCDFPIFCDLYFFVILCYFCVEGGGWGIKIFFVINQLYNSSV